VSHVLALSRDQEWRLTAILLAAGASGCLPKTRDMDDAIGAIRVVA
jgi:DNA-binding NarL/FixJ family response regulator